MKTIKLSTEDFSVMTYEECCKAANDFITACGINVKDVHFYMLSMPIEEALVEMINICHFPTKAWTDKFYWMLAAEGLKLNNYCVMMHVQLLPEHETSVKRLLVYHKDGGFPVAISDEFGAGFNYFLRRQLSRYIAEYANK